MAERYVLIGTDASFFTSKVRSYFDWKCIEYERLLPSDEVLEKTVVPMTSLLMIPALLVYSQDNKDGEPMRAINDSKAIMEYIEGKFPSPHAPLIPQLPKQRFSAMLLELLSDEWLIVQAMYWRWSPEHIKEQAGFIQFQFGQSAAGGQATLAEISAVGAARMEKFAGFCPGLGVTPSTYAAIRKQFRHLLKLLANHLEYHDYLLGSKPTVADFAFYGPFYGHLTRDPVPELVIKKEAPVVARWIERVGHARHYRYKNIGQSGEDKIPPTLLPILQFLLTDFAPLLRKAVDAVASFEQENPKETIPRFLGSTDFSLSIGNDVLATETRLISSHPVWMLQRILDIAYTTGTRSTCDNLLKQVDNSKSDVSHEWHGAVKSLEETGWKVARNERNQLITV